MIRAVEQSDCLPTHASNETTGCRSPSGHHRRPIGVEFHLRLVRWNPFWLDLATNFSAWCRVVHGQCSELCCSTGCTILLSRPSHRPCQRSLHSIYCNYDILHCLCCPINSHRIALATGIDWVAEDVQSIHHELKCM